MAVTLSATFQKCAAAKQPQVAVVRLYYDATHYYPLATKSVVISSEQHLACVKDIGTIATTWRLFEDNTVTLAAPTVTLMDYQTPNGWSLKEQFESFAFSGKRIAIFIGFEDISINDFTRPYDGIIDNVRFEGREILLECRVKETPDIEISGRQLHYASQLIGSDDYSANIEIPREADEKFLPVPFGSQWNSPLVCYDQQDDGSSSWASYDNSWWSADTTPSAVVTSYTRHNLNQNVKSVLLESEDYLTPLYTTAYDGSTCLTYGQDSNAGNLPRVGVAAPEDCPIVQYEQAVQCEVPLRIDGPFSDFTATNLSAYDSTGDIANIFDGNANTSWSMTKGTSSTSSSMVFLGRLPLDRNLRHDDRYVVYNFRPIHIPHAEPDDEWTVLWLGRLKNGSTMTERYTISVRLTPGMIWPSLNMGTSAMERTSGSGGGNIDYDYFSKLFERNYTVDWTQIDFEDDTQRPGPAFNQGWADAGNYSVVLSEGSLPFLRRQSFVAPELNISVSLVFNTTSAATTGSLVVYDVSYHAFETVNMRFDKPIYGLLPGITLTSEDSIYSKPSGLWSNQLYCPPQYVEAILRAKAGASDGDFNSTEWGNAADFFADHFSTYRDYSGFTLYKSTTFDKFVREYLRYEPFTVYRDVIGDWRIFWLHKDLTDIEANETIYTADFDDFTSIEVSLSPMENLVAEIKSLQTDKIYFNDEFTQKWHWKLPSTANPVAYDYDYWATDNTEAANRLFLPELKREYTSIPQPDRATVSSVGYGCLRTHKNKTPATAANIDVWWTKLACTSSEWGVLGVWSNSTTYRGADSENRALAKWLLNMWGNRKRVVRFTTTNPLYLKHEVGDYLLFSGVPFACGGLVVKGWADEADEEAADINNQDQYCYFIITEVRKKLGEVEIECVQTCDLTAYEPVTGDGVQAV